MDEKEKITKTEDLVKQIKEQDFPANSHRTRQLLAEQKPQSVEPGKDVKKVVAGPVVTRKKSFGKRVAEMFVGDDVANVKTYVLYDVLIPAMKATFSDMVSQGIEMLLFGETRRGGRTTRERGRSVIDYGKSYRTDSRPSTYSLGNRQAHQFDDIILTSRGEAEVVLSHLLDLIDDYGLASITDFYSLVGIQGTYMDNKWGWKNLSGSEVSRVRDGWIINLPKAIPLD